MQTIPERGMVMYTTIKIGNRRDAFTLVEMLVVIAIIITLAALAAAFAPRIDDNQKLTRAVDNLEQWLLTAKMRAKRDGLATGLRFVSAPGDAPGTYSQFQYIQQPEPLAGGYCAGGATAALPLPYYQYPPGTGNYYFGGLLTSATAGTVTFQGVDFSLGGAVLAQGLVQPGDYLEINGGGVFLINRVTPTTLTLNTTSGYASSLNITTPTTNFRILRQPRILIGEEPLTLPNNYAANFAPIPGSGSTLPGTNVALGPSLYPEILFSPTGAVIGTNAGTPILWISVWDTTMEVPDPNRVGIVGIQGRSGFIGAYSVSLSGNPFLFVQMARESGL
jgi:prepilin-type N-terminal cleavage/methylation domain-containing protein